MQSMETLATLAGMLEGELKGITPGADLFQNWRRIETDTRRLAEGDVFAAIRGERFDGHAYIESALEKGAAGCLCSTLPEALREYLKGYNLSEF